MIARGVILLVVWLALWGDVSAANVASGITVVVALQLAVPGRRRVGHRLHPVGVVQLVAFMLGNLVTSSWAVIRAVIRPEADRIHAEVIPVALATRSPLIATIVGNAITMTPGTMTVSCDVDDFVLQVHVLGRVEHQAFERSIHRLEARVLAAITTIGDPVGTERVPVDDAGATS